MSFGVIYVPADSSRNPYSINTSPSADYATFLQNIGSLVPTFFLFPARSID